jgi:hypothetical protein
MAHSSDPTILILRPIDRGIPMKSGAGKRLAAAMEKQAQASQELRPQSRAS